MASSNLYSNQKFRVKCLDTAEIVRIFTVKLRGNIAQLNKNKGYDVLHINRRSFNVFS